MVAHATSNKVALPRIRHRVWYSQYLAWGIISFREGGTFETRNSPGPSVAATTEHIHVVRSPRSLFSRPASLAPGRTQAGVLLVNYILRSLKNFRIFSSRCFKD